MNKKIFYSKILIVLVINFLLTNILVKEIFIAYTPKIYPNLAKRISLRLNNLIKERSQFIAKLLDKRSNQQEGTGLEKTKEKNFYNVAFQKITKGVYAKEVNNSSYILIKENEVEWIEYTFVINGKQVKIKVIKGEQPPSKEFLEQIYKKSRL